jgi:hypothetical protein
MRNLRRNAVIAARRGDTAASNRAVELIGKHLNMFVDRKEIQINYVDDADEYLARIMEQIEGPVIDQEPVAKQLSNDGSNDGSDEGVDYNTTDIIDKIT